MANLQVKDASGSSVYVKATGDGSGGTPYIVEHLDTNSAAAAASLSVMDDWDETDRAKVNLIVGQAGVAAGAGAVGATVQRVTLASDDPGVVSLQVMDDWDESDRAKVNLIVGQAGIAAGAGAVGATVPRVTLASDDPAVTSLSVLDDWDDTDRAKVALPADVITITPTVDTNAYTSGDAVGGKQTLTSAARVSGGKVLLDSLTVLDLSNQKPNLTILFFDSDPSMATIANNDAFAWSTETSKFIGKVNVATADFETVDSEAIATLRNLGLILKASGSANLYAAVVTTSTPTLTGVSDLTFKYGFDQRN